MTDSDGLFAVADLEYVEVVESGVEAGAGAKMLGSAKTNAAMSSPRSSPGASRAW